ncbi:hypothetical protein ESCO_002839 [Escovopsis weberi]|uniref:Uncharacterized protein n=1 Tax=Escovopsis weberi TaxID=150374 RepID=A0A0N0RT02_ESCWE|nr:hypothetical protein ESCO_002839 [Escovopsis weberi]
MRRSIAHLALGGTLAAAAAAATASNETAMVDLYFWGFRGEIPVEVQGKVIDSKPSATTYEITCEDTADPGFMDLEDLEAAQTMDCTAKDDPQTITCTNIILYTYSGTTETVSGVSTRHNFHDYTISVNVTSGLDKLTAAPGNPVPPPAATPTGETSVVSMFNLQLGDDTMPIDLNDLAHGAVASVISADAALTTYAIRCPPVPINPNHDSACELVDEEVTYVHGPSTFSYSQELVWDYTHDTMILDCSVRESDAATCTQYYNYARGPDATSGTALITLTEYESRMFQLTVTAGLEKLKATPGGTVNPTAKVTGTNAASSTGKPTGKPDTANAAGQASARGALIAGAAASAFLGFVLML